MQGSIISESSLIHVGKDWHGVARLESNWECHTLMLTWICLFKLFKWVQHSPCIQPSVLLKSNLIFWSNIFCGFFSAVRNLVLGCRLAHDSWSAECPHYWGKPKVRGNLLCSIWYKSHKQQNCRVRYNRSSLPAMLFSTLFLHRNFCSIRQARKDSFGFKNTCQTH